MLSQKPEDPLPVRKLIFLNRNDNIRAWFLANNGHNSLDLIVLKSCDEDGEDLDETPEPPNRRYPFFGRDIWDDSAGGEGSVGAIVEEESVDDEEWLEAEPAGGTRVPPRTGVIYLDDRDVSIQTNKSVSDISHPNGRANCRYRISHREIQAPQHAGGIFHHKLKYW